MNYSKDLTQARVDQRTGNNPMMIKAQRASGPNRTDLVISNQDALTLSKVTENLKFLQECRVTIVLD